jgi:uncharacterized membrane protein
MSPTIEEIKAPPPAAKPETASQSLGTGAAGGAAMGSVVALLFAAGNVVLPLVGGVVGAGGGALLGYLLHRKAEGNKAEESTTNK